MLTKRESHIEKRVCEYAEEKGWLTFKWSSPGRCGVPDRLFFRNKVLVIIEAKRKGEKARLRQRLTHSRLKKQGFDVHIINTIGAGKKLFDSFEPKKKSIKGA